MVGAMSTRALVLTLCGLLWAGPTLAQDETATETVTTQKSDSDFWADVEEFFAGNWLDPPGQFWAPRRGKRLELALFIGPEGSLGAVSPAEIGFDAIGGGVGQLVLRWYPVVDHVAVIFTPKVYLGFNNQPAAGTAASTVFSPMVGVRYDLVKENRLSLLVDVMSGPTGFIFAGPDSVELLDVFAPPESNLLLDPDKIRTAVALGAELMGAVAARYSLGPATLESRLLLGGRVGSAQEIGRPAGDVGPFSSLYAGVDLGITFSFFADSHDGSWLGATDELEPDAP